MVKNIIILCDFGFVDGGATKVAIDSANLLANANYNVVYFCAVKPTELTHFEANVKVECLEQFDILHNPSRFEASCQGLWNARAYKMLSNLLNEYSSKDTIVHIHTWTKALSPSIWQLLSELSFNVVLTTHDYFSFCPTGGMYNYKRKKICNLKPMGGKCFFCNCDSRSYMQKMWRNIRQVIQNHYMASIHKLWIIAISQTTQKLCKENYVGHTRGFFLLNNPIDINVKGLVDLNRNDTYLFLGRVSLEKGVDLFCKAITSLHKKGIVVGDGYLKTKLEKMYPSIQFVGWQSGYQKDLFIRMAKALVFPSLWYEGAPLTIQEMKSYGIPCIVPDKCAASEQVENGKTGYVFKTGDLQSLKDAILKYENTDLAQMQKNLKESFNPEELSMETHLKRLVKIYNEILENDKK